jgi:cyclopropane fatty-acyl-phospholipid synthase-like methyltransferase
MTYQRMNYRFAYGIGFHPWEDAQGQAAFVDSLSALVRREETATAQHGTALDLGTGSGIWAVWLAQRGWEVTAVDVVEKALERARQRVRDAGADVRIVSGDVTDLRSAGAGSGFRLILDTGTFHGLSGAQRDAMAKEVTAVAAPGATLLLLAWQPRRRGPFPHGADLEDLETAFSGWQVTDEGPTGFSAPPPVELLLRPHERWYRMTRS